VLHVVGSFSGRGRVHANGGSLFVTGMSDLDGKARDQAGEYQLAIGSVTRGSGVPLMLREDGTQVVVQPDANGSVELAGEGSRFCAWNANEQRFIPLANG
jgi:hypothetical protein